MACCHLPSGFWKPSRRSRTSGRSRYFAALALRPQGSGGIACLEAQSRSDGFCVGCGLSCARTFVLRDLGRGEFCSLRQLLGSTESVGILRMHTPVAARTMFVVSLTSLDGEPLRWLHLHCTRIAPKSVPPPLFVFIEERT